MFSHLVTYMNNHSPRGFLDKRWVVHLVAPKFDEVAQLLDAYGKEKRADGTKMLLRVFFLTKHIDNVSVAHKTRVEDLHKQLAGPLEVLGVELDIVKLSESYTEVMYQRPADATGKNCDSTWAGGVPDIVTCRDVYHYLSSDFVRDIPKHDYVVFSAQNWTDVNSANMLVSHVKVMGTDALSLSTNQGGIVQEKQFESDELDPSTVTSIAPNLNQTYNHNLSVFRPDGPAKTNDVRTTEANLEAVKNQKAYTVQRHLCQPEYTSEVDNFGVIVLISSTKVLGITQENYSISEYAATEVPFYYYVSGANPWEYVALLAIASALFISILIEVVHYQRHA